MLFYFGVRVEVEVEDANERIFLWGQMQTGDFPLGSGLGSRMQSHWTYCMILVLMCKHA